MTVAFGKVGYCIENAPIGIDVLEVGIIVWSDLQYKQVS